MSGPVALLGSGEFEPWAEGADRWLLERSAGEGPILVAPAASAPEGEAVFGRWARLGVGHYGRLGASAEVLALRTRDDAEDGRVVARLDEASAIFFSGGNPAYLTSTLAGTPFWDRLLERMAEGLGFGGCSAGAAALGEMVPDSSRTDPLHDGAWGPGLAHLHGALILPHWDAIDDHLPGFRAWVERTLGPGRTLVGLDERTALLGDGRSWRVAGNGSAWVRRGDAWAAFGSGETLPPGVLRRGA